jgi:hypothetical protein
MGEAFKVPFVMRQMLDPRGDRRRLAARILGFRETIFTREHSAVGEAMAGSEWTFGRDTDKQIMPRGNLPKITCSGAGESTRKYHQSTQSCMV